MQCTGAPNMVLQVFFCEKAKHPHGNHRAQNQGQVQHLQFSKEKAAEVVMGGHDYVLPSTLSFAI